MENDRIQALGHELQSRFTQYLYDRRLLELKWMRSLRQYLGIYDPEIEAQLDPNRSKAYPKVTRTKIISTLARLMHMMFPANERNWSLEPSPVPDLDPNDVDLAIQKATQTRQLMQLSGMPSDEEVQEAIYQLAKERAEDMARILDDQLTEIGGDQTRDYIGLCRKVVLSGLQYGVGLLQGPFVREEKYTQWQGQASGSFAPTEAIRYKPQYETISVWDWYPDLTGKTLKSGDGYFLRHIMSRHQVRKLADRPGFMSDVILKYLQDNKAGNFKQQTWEMEIKVLGIKSNVNDAGLGRGKYELISWHGYISGHDLKAAGEDIADDQLSDDFQSEVWLLDGKVISAQINPWLAINADVDTLHVFIYDEDDSQPTGNSLAQILRDSQMTVASSTRMMLDNASIICGPQVEINTDLLRQDQDISSIEAYKRWYREGTGPEAQWPAVRQIEFNSHITELMEIIKYHMDLADMESFVNPANQGDIANMPSEAMRTMGGASMIHSNAALPFRDVVRNFDTFTESVIYSLVQFNRKFNGQAKIYGDYNVIARGATSLIAKEVRGIQLDTFAATLSPQDELYVDRKALLRERAAVRDVEVGNILVSDEEVLRRQEAQQQAQQAQQQLQEETIRAEVRKTLAEAVKNLTQADKNKASAETSRVNAMLDALERGLHGEQPNADTGSKKKPSTRKA
jgi:hypothetical protein